MSVLKNVFFKKKTENRKMKQEVKEQEKGYKQRTRGGTSGLAVVVLT